MAQLATINPLNQFFALDGSPLNNGKLYFGEINKDPQQFPVQMFWDAAGLVPALQPIRTTSGYPSRSGAPAILYCAVEYSLRVRQSNDVQVFYIPRTGSASLQTFGQWQPSNVTPSFASVNSFTLTGDQTAEFQIGRRARFVVTAGTVYGTISSSVYAALTTVTMVMDDSFALDSGLSSVDLSILTAVNSAVPGTIARAGAVIQPINATVAANALTLTLNPTALDFRSATLGSGTVNNRYLPTATSCIVPSGATLGTINAQLSRVMLLALDNAGIVELAVVNLSGGNDLSETGLISTTVLSAASDSSNVIYSTTARTNVPYRVVGFVDSTQATAGTWATAPSTIQGIGGQAAAMASAGFGQTWQSVTRVAGTTYYATPNKMIFIRAGVNSGGAASGTLTIDGMTFSMVVNNSSNYAAFPVGPGKAYSFTGSIDISHEFR